MRKSLLALLVPVAITVVALAIVAANDERGRVAGLAVSPVAVATDMKPGQETCQSPIAVRQPFARVRFQVGTHFRPGPELVVTVRDANSGSRLVLSGGKQMGSQDAQVRGAASLPA